MSLLSLDLWALERCYDIAGRECLRALKFRCIDYIVYLPVGNSQRRLFAWSRHSVACASAICPPAPHLRSANTYSLLSPAHHRSPNHQNKKFELRLHRLTPIPRRHQLNSSNNILTCHKMRPQYLQTATKFAGGVLCYAIGAGIYDKFFQTETISPQGNDLKLKMSS
jgi:hypothetical protein